LGLGGVGRLLVFEHVYENGFGIKVPEDNFFVDKLKLDDFLVHLKKDFFEFFVGMFFGSELLFNQHPDLATVRFQRNHAAALNQFCASLIHFAIQSNHAHI
jgi:hypothetical protein